MVLRSLILGGVCLLAGCDNSMKNGEGPSRELDSEFIEGEHAPQFGQTFKEVALYNGFDLNVVDPLPPKHFKVLNLSEQEGVYVSLQSLAYLPEPKRFLIATADTINVKGMPKLTGLKGYKAALKVEGNSLFVEVQSEGKPTKYKRPEPIQYDANEIVVGGIINNLLAYQPSNKGGYIGAQLQDAYMGYNFEKGYLKSAYNERKSYQQVEVSVGRAYPLHYGNVGVNITYAHSLKQQIGKMIGGLDYNLSLSFCVLRACIVSDGEWFGAGGGIDMKLNNNGSILKALIATSDNAYYAEVRVTFEY